MAPKMPQPTSCRTQPEPHEHPVAALTLIATFVVHLVSVHIVTGPVQLQDCCSVIHKYKLSPYTLSASCSFGAPCARRANQQLRRLVAVGDGVALGQRREDDDQQQLVHAHSAAEAWRSAVDQAAAATAAPAVGCAAAPRQLLALASADPMFSSTAVRMGADNLHGKSLIA